MVNNAKEFLESHGIEFEPDEFWGEESIGNDWKFKDLIYYMEEYAKTKIKNENNEL